MTSVTIVGGGLGGLSAAISLASEGFDVTVLEQNERIGGKCNVREGEGFSFDTGPSILTMPWVLEQLFERAGENLHDYVSLTRVEPQWRTFFEDGETIDLHGDLPTMLKEIERISKADAQGFLQYMNYSSKMYELCMKSFYKRSLTGLTELRSYHTLPELLKLDPLKSMASGTKRYIEDPHLQQLLNFLVMYVGSSPYQAPAVMSQLAHVQFGLGIYYVEGGLYNIVKAMEKVLIKLGVTIKTKTKVTKIVNEKDLVSGVELATGQTIKSDYVVSNREVVSTYADLLPEHTNKPLVHKYEPTVSGLVMLLGINRDYEQLAHHNFFFSKDPELEFKQIYEEKRPADDPTVYIGISSKSDPTQAPEGKANFFILTHVPPLNDNENWQEQYGSYRDVVLSKLERNGLNGLRDCIEFDYTFTPNDLHDLYGSVGGSIYGVTANRKTNGGFKIPSQSSAYHNLYFVGGSTHPGGGVPMVTLSGQLTADLIVESQQTTNKSSKHII
ncbi:phytoene desaturase family protein [Geomicrobium sediminis]|uniref:4,4'-diaponeurosporene oxygenase n=1 Tax=Geomicrobium sediminis TaxID=1347788 RepID=A0ABS2PAV1_9BACL|nr:phytoene desaturase family protein [Geomicrobium sediminis]MBM7632447.1 diapolycopene oxygenase [Geomicrobium sediminis]